MRWVLLLHRWLGIGIGWLLLAWCLSGVVMMYVAYPALTPEQQAGGLAELDLTSCCRLPDGDRYLTVDAYRIEMLGGAPVLRAMTSRGYRSISLRSGQAIDEVRPEDAKWIADGFRRRSRLAGQARYLDTRVRDQWTVAGYGAYQPLHRFALDDAAGTELYVAGTNGEVVQLTTAPQRFWNWLGAVTHWIYPTLLRQHPGVWIQVIIWTSLVGVFLTSLGLYVGIARLGRRRSGRWSPYRGLALWHHYLGLVFGILTLTWLASGALSVNPWGLLETGGLGADAARLRQFELPWSALAAQLDRLSQTPLPAGTVRLESAALAGEPYYIAHARDGSRERLDAATLRPAALDRSAIEAAAPRLQPAHRMTALDRLTQGDAYYFSHHRPRTFPVYRVVFDDPERTRYYLDAVTGAVVQKTGASERWYRWLFLGLHRIDFSPSLRERPLRDVVLWVLMAGVTGVCFTGTYMGIRYLKR